MEEIVSQNSISLLAGVIIQNYTYLELAEYYLLYFWSFNNSCVHAAKPTTWVTKSKLCKNPKTIFRKAKKIIFFNLHKSKKFEESNHTELLYCEFINKVLFPNKNNQLQFHLITLLYLKEFVILFKYLYLSTVEWMENICKQRLKIFG